MPYYLNQNVEFTNGKATIDVPGIYVKYAPLAVNAIWNEVNFSGSSEAQNGKIVITGYKGTTPLTGIQWIAISGIIQY